MFYVKEKVSPSVDVTVDIHDDNVFCTLSLIHICKLRLASLLQTDHMLASVFFTQLTRAMKEY